MNLEENIIRKLKNSSEVNDKEISIEKLPKKLTLESFSNDDIS